MSEELIVLEKDVEEDYDLRFLDHHNSTYSREQKLAAVQTYMLTGSLTQTALNTGLPDRLIINWKQNAVWWDEALEKARKLKQDTLDATLTNTIHNVTKKLVERLEEGDPYIKKDGDIGFMPIKFKELAVGMAVLYDKRALIRGEATSIRKESQESLKTLENRFKEFALQLKEKDVVSKQ